MVAFKAMEIQLETQLEGVGLCSCGAHHLGNAIAFVAVQGKEDMVAFRTLKEELKTPLETIGHIPGL